MGMKNKSVPTSKPASKPKSGVERFLLSRGMHPIEAAGGFRPKTKDSRIEKKKTKTTTPKYKVVPLKALKPEDLKPKSKDKDVKKKKKT